MMEIEIMSMIKINRDRHFRDELFFIVVDFKMKLNAIKFT